MYRIYVQKSTKLLSYFVEINPFILTFIWKNKRPRIAKSIIKENKDVGHTRHRFRKCYKATAIYAVWFWRLENIPIGQWNRMETPETHPNKYTDKGAAAINEKKEILFNKWCWNKQTFAGNETRKRKLNINDTLYIEINFKKKQDSPNCKIIKLLGKI